MFPLSGEASVAGHGGPSVAERLGARTAHVDHGFDRKDVADFDERAALAVAEVENRRLLVEPAPDAVAAVVFHDAETVFVGDILDGAADVAPACTAFTGGANAFFHAELGRVDEFLRYVRNLAYAEHGGCVAVVARQDGRDVDVHDIAVLEDSLCVGDAVAHDFVDTDAGVPRVAVVAHAGGDTLVVAGVVADEFVNFECRDTGLAHFARTDEGFGCKCAGVAYKFDFLSGFYFDLCHFMPSSKRSGR